MAGPRRRDRARDRALQPPPSVSSCHTLSSSSPSSSSHSSHSSQSPPYPSLRPPSSPSSRLLSPLLSLLLLSLSLALLLLHPAPALALADPDGVFDSGTPGGMPGGYSGGVATQDASVSDLSVPLPSGDEMPTGYFQSIGHWFTSWLANNGVDTSAVKIVMDEGPESKPWKRPHMKLVATRNLAADEILFTLPRSVQLSSQAILHAENPYKDPSEPTQGWAAYTAIASWILRERTVDTNSPWAPYLRLLPPSVSLPIFFPDELVAELQFSTLVSLVRDYKGAIEAQYAMCRPDAIHNATMAEFYWAMAIAMSRAFDGPLNPDLETSNMDADGHALLLPMADMMDHSNHYNVESRLDLEGGFVFYVNKEMKEGEELQNQYGLKNTDYLITSYGFVLDPNEQDSITLAHRLNGSRDIYRAYYSTEKTPFGENEESWALYVSSKANVTTSHHAAYERSTGTHAGTLIGPKYDLAYPEALNAWQGGIVDPPLLAGLAATVFYLGFGKEPDYDALARLSTWYGWNLYEGTCRELAEHVPMKKEELEAFVSAAAGVKTLVDSMLQQLPTTLEDDEHILAAMEVCKAGGDPVEGDAEMKQYCETVSGGGITMGERELVVRARLAKKRVLREVSVRFGATCALEGSAQEPDGSASAAGINGDSGEESEGESSEGESGRESGSEGVGEDGEKVADLGENSDLESVLAAAKKVAAAAEEGEKKGKEVKEEGAGEEKREEVEMSEDDKEVEKAEAAEVEADEMSKKKGARRKLRSGWFL